MSIELILGGIGTLLGVANFAYWAWWAKRDKIAIVNSEVYPEFLHTGSWIDNPDGARIFLHNYAELSMEVSCELVLTCGEKELEVREVEVVLDKKVCESLIRYFFIPRRNRLQLRYINVYEENPVPQPILLVPKKAVRFKREIRLNCTDEFAKDYEKLEGGFCPEFIKALLDELEIKYQICWERYDGKRLCWRFPDRWWRNLGKKLWG